MEEKDLLKIINSDGETQLELMLRDGLKPDCENYEKKASLDIILKTRRYDLLPYVSIKNLLRRKTLNETYIDYILKKFKTNKRINISLFDPFEKGASISEIAQLYIKYAEHDLLGYLPDLTKENLLQMSKNGRFLFFGSNMLEILLSRNTKLTLEKIIPVKLQKDFDVALELNLNDIFQKKVNIDLHDSSLADDYIKENNKKYKSMYQSLSQEDQMMINHLYSAYLDTSDKKALYTVINSYVEQLYNKNPNAIYEIRQLLIIKSKDDRFRFIDGEDNYYNAKENHISINTHLTSVINHEMGHALYHNLTDGNEDKEFDNILEEIRYNPFFLNNVSQFSDKYHNNLGLMRIYTINRYYSTFYNIEDKDSIKKIKEFLNKSIEEKKKEYLEKGYSEEMLDVLLSNSFTVQEFLKQHEKIQTSELKQTMMKNENDVFLAVADIIDAVTKGEFSAGMLKNVEGQKIKPCAGHGLFYYNVMKSLIFDEIIANYSLIIKSNKREEGIFWLRKCCGNKLVDYLEKYYNNTILRSEEYTFERSVAHGRV